MTTKVDNYNIKRFDLENDYTMKEKLWTVLVTSILLPQCCVEVDANSIHLLPSPTAKVEEGETLTLNCSCNESNNPDLINWYLNNDTFGLVIKARSCMYLIRPEKYDINRYRISCYKTLFQLSIANISKGDHQDTWECDTTVAGMYPQHKASTRIMVMEYTGQPDTKSKQFEKPMTAGQVTLVVVGVILAITVIAAVGYFLYRKRRNDSPHWVKSMKNKHTAESQMINHVEDHVLYRDQMGEC